MALTVIFILRFERIVLFATTQNVMTREPGGRDSQNEKCLPLSYECTLLGTLRECEKTRFRLLLFFSYYF